MPDHPTTASGDELMQRFEDLDDPRRQTGRFQFPLQEALERTGAEDRVVTLLGHPFLGLLVQRDRDALVGEPALVVTQPELDHLRACMEAVPC